MYLLLFAVGFLVFTLMLKIAVPISLGEFTAAREASGKFAVAEPEDLFAAKASFESF